MRPLTINLNITRRKVLVLLAMGLVIGAAKVHQYAPKLAAWQIYHWQQEHEACTVNKSELCFQKVNSQLKYTVWIGWMGEDFAEHAVVNACMLNVKSKALDPKSMSLVDYDKVLSANAWSMHIRGRNSFGAYVVEDVACFGNGEIMVQDK